MLHQIGVGALGPVFRTYEPTRDRLVAVKVFRLDITPEQSASLAEALARAAEAGLFHPSIVEPIAAGIEGTVAYRAEEYVAAESLDVAMRHYAPATLDKVLPFITQLAGAIDFARAAGVGHGALHPRDIFVTPEEARATGFGVVDALERVGLRAPVRRPYSAPERVASAAWGTPADVFSLAAIAFELLTARRPAGLGDQMGSLTGAAIPAHADRIHTVLVRAMDEDPTMRHPSALAFAGALEKASRGEVTSAPVRAVSTTAAAAAVVNRAELGANEPQPIAAGPSSEAVSPSVPPDAPVDSTVSEDIETERDEDEAHWQLTKEEARAAEDAGEPERDEESLFDDEMVAAAADGLALSAADMALNEPRASADADEAEPPRFADEFRESAVAAPDTEPVHDADTERFTPAALGPASVTSIGSRREAQSRSIVHPVPPPRERLPNDDSSIAAEHALFESSSPPLERVRTPMLPIAVTLILGLLLGFVAGYGMRGRQAERQTVAQDAAQRPTAGDATTQGTAGSPQGRGKEWSEQAVARQAASPPPPVPSDAPASKPATPARASAPAPPAPKAGKIVVRSRPSGAGVTLNGKWRGRTPFVLDNAAFGKYALRVVLPGYDVARESFNLSATDTSKTLSYDLKRQPAAVAQAPAAKKPASSGTATSGISPGAVFVDSNPRGARIFLDGKPMGVTPLRIGEVPIGSHVVRLELPDHRAWTGATTVVSGKEARVTGSLEPDR